MEQDLRVEHLELVDGAWQHRAYFWDAKSVKSNLERLGVVVDAEEVVQHGNHQWRFFIPTHEERWRIIYEDVPF